MVIKRKEREESDEEVGDKKKVERPKSVTVTQVQFANTYTTLVAQDDCCPPSDPVTIDSNVIVWRCGLGPQSKRKQNITTFANGGNSLQQYKSLFFSVPTIAVTLPRDLKRDIDLNYSHWK